MSLTVIAYWAFIGSGLFQEVGYLKGENNHELTLVFNLNVRL